MDCGTYGGLIWTVGHRAVKHELWDVRRVSMGCGTYEG